MTQFNQRLLQARIQSLSRAKRQQQRQEFQSNLIDFYSSFEQTYQTRRQSELLTDVQKQKEYEFRRRLLETRIRNDLVARRIVAKQRMDELHKSILESKRQTEEAVAAAALAEEERRQALKEQETFREEERKAILEQQISESLKKQEDLKKQMEDAGRLQSEEAPMTKYEEKLQRQRQESMQLRIEEAARRQEDLRKQMEEAGRQQQTEEAPMNLYEETLQRQRHEAIQRRIEESQRRQEELMKQMEQAGRQQPTSPPENMMEEWKAQQQKQQQQGEHKTTLANASKASPVKPRQDQLRRAMEQAGRQPPQPQPKSPAGLEIPEPQVQQQAIPPPPPPPEAVSEIASTTTSQQPEDDPLIGEVLLDKFFITEKLRVGGDRSELFKCYHTLDKAQQFPLVIKLSHNIEQIELEHRIYGDLFSRLTPDQQQFFVRAYDWVTPSPLTQERVGFVMECGLENLRGYVWRHGPYKGDRLRKAMGNVISILYSLHDLGVVWTELKAENFIVFSDGVIKAIDLESVAAHQECLRAYTAETYPPEFPAESLYQCLPQIPVDYSFDVWGLGLTLFEIAVGEPLFTLQRTYDVDYIRERLKNPESIVAEANKKMWKVESGARNIIRQCLVVDPMKRTSCQQLLQDPYFQQQQHTSSNQPNSTFYKA